MYYNLTETPPIDSNLQTVFSRRCTQFLCSPITGRRNEWMHKDIDQWEAIFSGVPRFSALNAEQLAKVKIFVTVGIRLAYLTYSDIEIVIDNDFDTLSLSLTGSSFVMYENALECLNELDRLSDRVTINAFPINQRSMGILAMIPLTDM